MHVVVEADGGARGNPGPAGWGAVVRDAASGQVLAERAEAIGTATNNVAEYGGLIAGLRAAAELGATRVEVRMDSKLVIEQMAGRWKIKHPGLRPLAAEAAALAHRFDRVSWRWVPRERNRAADRLANQAMDAAAGTGPAPPGADRGVGPESAADPETDPESAADAAADRQAAPEPDLAAERRPAGRGSWEPPAGPPTRLLLVRHGATELTAQRRYAGRADSPLSAAGARQATAVARRVAGLVPQLAAVVTSPLARCTATATAIATAAGNPPVVVEPDLVECDFGQWEGRTFAEIRTQWPEQVDNWLRTAAAAPPGGESMQQVAKRVRRVGASLREAYPGQPVAVVSHVWPLKVMLRDALAAGDAFLHRLLLSPAGLSVIDTYPDGTVAVRTVNETAHLP